MGGRKTPNLVLIMNFEHSMIGWCQEGTSDKVWGAVLVSRKDSHYKISVYGIWMIFWGRRGRALQTKLTEPMLYAHIHDLHFRKKLDKGYQEVDRNKLDEVYPEFQADLEKTAMWARLRST